MNRGEQKGEKREEKGESKVQEGKEDGEKGGRGSQDDVPVCARASHGVGAGQS